MFKLLIGPNIATEVIKKTEPLISTLTWILFVRLLCELRVGVTTRRLVVRWRGGTGVGGHFSCNLLNKSPENLNKHIKQLLK